MASLWDAKNRVAWLLGMLLGVASVTGATQPGHAQPLDAQPPDTQPVAAQPVAVPPPGAQPVAVPPPGAQPADATEPGAPGGPDGVGDGAGDKASSADSGVDPEVAEAIARVLFQRSKELVALGDYVNAKMLLGESLERSAEGPVAQEALTLLQSCNQQLGIPDLNHGAPAALGLSTSADAGMASDGLMDPYGVDSGDATLDPYAEPVSEAQAADSRISATQAPVAEPEVSFDQPTRYNVYAARRPLMLFGGSYGFVLGLAAGGPDDSGDLLLGVIGAGVGLGAGYALTHYYQELSGGQAAAIAWSGAWGSLIGGLISDLATGIDTSSSPDIVRGIALGGLAGAGTGWLLGQRVDPSPGDVAVTTSLGLYGAGAGLLIGLAMNPVESEGYSLNMLIGTAVGLGVGFYVAPRVEASSRRMLLVDLGAASGAVLPWLIAYPLLDGDSDSNIAATGVLSALGLFGGAYLTWRLTGGVDAKADPNDKPVAVVPGLIQRSAAGHWGFGMPGIRPAENPVLAPRTGAWGMAIDVLGGQF